MQEEMFESSLRSSGDLAGVFEYDGEVGYFYLYDKQQTPGVGNAIRGAIRVLSGAVDFEKRDVRVSWDADERRVGLLIRDRLWAAFDAETEAQYGGNYHRDGESSVPSEIQRLFGR
jgi:hypothetical protein